jgi:hypothetical protein
MIVKDVSKVLILKRNTGQLDQDANKRTKSVPHEGATLLKTPQTNFRFDSGSTPMTLPWPNGSKPPLLEILQLPFKVIKTESTQVITRGDM